MPDIDGVRYEIIDGDLYVSEQPHWHHQVVCSEIVRVLQNWNHATGAGVAAIAPGLIFAPDDDVAPDVVWTSRARISAALDAAGHLRVAPELVVEVLSPDATNERRDRELKLKLYSRQGVLEYWLVDWCARQLQVYRRAGAALELQHTLLDGDTLTTPLLPGFSCAIAELWSEAA